jgi:hypothetical protein
VAGGCADSSFLNLGGAAPVVSTSSATSFTRVTFDNNFGSGKSNATTPVIKVEASAIRLEGCEFRGNGVAHAASVPTAAGAHVYADGDVDVVATGTAQKANVSRLAAIPADDGFGGQFFLSDKSVFLVDLQMVRTPTSRTY